MKQALAILNELSQDAILFVVDANDKLIGSLTDGDIRRALLNNFTIEGVIDKIIQPNPRFIRKGNYDIQKIIEYRERDFRIIPVLDDNDIVVNVINFRYIKSYLPIDAVIMAGGRGQRLQPLTDHTPKPLLKVGTKPIMEHNLNRLVMFGIDDFWVSVKYLGKQIDQFKTKLEAWNYLDKEIQENLRVCESDVFHCGKCKKCLHLAYYNIRI